MINLSSPFTLRYSKPLSTSFLHSRSVSINALRYAVLLFTYERVSLTHSSGPTFPHAPQNCVCLSSARLKSYYVVSTTGTSVPTHCQYNVTPFMLRHLRVEMHLYFMHPNSYKKKSVQLARQQLNLHHSAVKSTNCLSKTKRSKSPFWPVRASSRKHASSSDANRVSGLTKVKVPI